MRINQRDKQLAIILDGLARDEYKMMMASEILSLLRSYDYGAGICKKKDRPQWYWKACGDLDEVLKIPTTTKYTVWEFNDRFKKALYNLEELGVGIKIIDQKGKKRITDLEVWLSPIIDCELLTEEKRIAAKTF